jgi:hypothetical protein
MKIARLLQLIVQCLFTPLIEFIRYWQNDQFGQRLVQVVIELVVLWHLLKMLGPHISG